jgi:hypothetical protein
VNSVERRTNVGVDDGSAPDGGDRARSPASRTLRSVTERHPAVEADVRRTTRETLTYEYSKSMNNE